jgi:hypothetical protein
MIAKNFVTGGKATFTVEVPDAFRTAKAQIGEQWHAHYTYRVERVELPATGNWPAKTCYFVKSLAGQDNTSDYVYLGMLDAATGEVKLTAKSAFTEKATRVKVIRRVLAVLWADKGELIAAAGWDVHHEGACARCGRALTVPESVKSGFGPECGKVVAGVAA